LSTPGRRADEAQLVEALPLWRGDALGDLVYDGASGASLGTALVD
jgi:hypothetical protein